MYDSMLAICWILDPVQNSNFSCTELNTFNGDTNDNYKFDGWFNGWTSLVRPNSFSGGTMIYNAYQLK